jgi:hypothetical protein
VRAWEIWTGPVFGPHPVLLVSAQARIDRKQALVVLKGVTMRPGQPFKVDALQATLDQEDGLETQTRFDCDLLYTLEKKDLSQRRGEWCPWNDAGISPERSCRAWPLPASKTPSPADWLRLECAIEKPSNKLLAATDLDSGTWVGEAKRIRGKKQPLTAVPSVLRFPLSAFPISAFPPAHPRPRRRNLDTGALAKCGTRNSECRVPDGDWSHVNHRPTSHPHPAATKAIAGRKA